MDQILCREEWFRYCGESSRSPCEEMRGSETLDFGRWVNMTIILPCVLLKEEEFIITVCFCHAKDDTIDYKYMMPMEKEINIRQNSTESLESEQHYKYCTDYIYWQTEFSICWCGRHIKYKIFLAAWFCCWKMKSWYLRPAWFLWNIEERKASFIISSFFHLVNHAKVKVVM